MTHLGLSWTFPRHFATFPLAVLHHPVDLAGLHEGQFVGNLLLDEIRHRSVGGAFRPSESHQGVHHEIPLTAVLSTSHQIIATICHRNMVDTCGYL